MKKPKPKFAEPETLKGNGGKLWESSSEVNVMSGPVRIVREKDYQRMKKLCQAKSRGR